MNGRGLSLLQRHYIAAMRPVILLRVVLVATALVLSDVLTIERTDACPDEHLPSLIGLPQTLREA
jgi:hypothetical protein